MRLLQTLMRVLKKSYLLIPIQLLLFLFFYSNINAQGWEKSYAIAGYENLRTEYMSLTQDGGFCLTATIDDPSAKDIAVMKLDAEGNQQWLSIFGDVFDDKSARIFQLGDGGYIIGGSTGNNTIGGNSGSNPDVMDWYVLRLDELGNKIWDKNYGSSGSEEFNALVPTADYGFLLIGEGGIDRIFLRKIDSVGEEEWIKTVGPSAGFSEGRDVKVTSDGGYIITGAHKPLGNDPLYDKNFFTIKVNQNGIEEWSHKHGGLFHESGEEVIETQDGGYACAGFKSWDETNADLYIVKFNAIGDTLWTKTFGTLDNAERGFTIVEADNGDLIAFGNSVNTSTNEGFGYTVRTNADGNLIEERVLTEGSAVGFPGVILPTPDEGFIIAGTGDSIIGLIKTDANLNSLTILVEGNVFYDIDNDCTYDNGEMDLEEWIVIADGEGSNDYFAFTDANGNYEILCDTGEFQLRVVSPNALWEMCTGSDGFGLSLNEFFDTIQVDFAMRAIAECPNMTVDLSAPQLRRCFENTYYVQYCNDGTLDEADAFIEIIFDPYLNVTTSSLSYNDIGNNTFSFDVGNVAIGECGDFTVNVMVDCDSTVLGQTHCVEAHIYPDTLCSVPPLWDGSSMEVDAVCVGDSITFSVTNVGINPPGSPNVVRIIEDDLVVLIQIFDLDPNETQSQTFLAEGQTFRMEVDQTPGHPGNSNPSVTIEGCGVDIENAHLGFVTQFPMDDENHFIDFDCQENIGSYDPNDKAAYPKGYFAEHFIGDDDELEYHIRFQNTGTDTAFTVVLRDTLSEFLDPSSIQLGTSSHDYSAELLGQGILKFTFENILLPDSSVNLIESNGFVKFTIQQKEGNTPGTVIENSAGIYFDFNEPVITGTVFHTIENETNYVVEEIGICEGDWFMGVEIFEDTILIDTIPEIERQDIVFTSIELLKHSYSDSTVIINNGEMINGIPIFADTIIIIEEVAANGCDSLQRVDVTVDVDNPIGFNPNFKVHPNPTMDIFYVNYELEESTLINLTLYDVLGKKVGTVIENELQSSGVKSYKIETDNFVGNVLFVHLQNGNKNYIQKVIFTTP